MFILASASPRRIILMGKILEDFQIEAANIDEDALIQRFSADEAIEYPEKDPDKLKNVGALVELLAMVKAENICQKYPKATILASDTVVARDGLVLGKPNSKVDAITTLRLLSGAWHEVYTAVAIIHKDKKIVFHELCRVKFNPLDEYQENLIQAYVASGHAQDKAGAYGIQEEGAFLIEKIEGDYYTVVGLPLNRTRRELVALGII